ncbi:MAG TPA: hypothetical protein VFF70_13855, partial [Anaerolineae bacterium]|nr:hypothetical protein [Anaerolineae bacterium]
SLIDGSYQLRARSIASGTISDTTPAAITFTLDTVAPLTPTVITPNGGITIVSPAPIFVWSSGGNPTRFEINLDGITTSVNSPLTATQLNVSDGLHQWRVRAFDAATNASGWSDIAQFHSTSFKSYLPMTLKEFAEVIPPDNNLTCTSVIPNGDFETGNWLPEWQSLSQNPIPGVVTTNVYSGSTSARVGAAPGALAISTGFSSIQQLVAIPANALTATLSFAYNLYSGDTINDLQYVAVLSSGPIEFLIYQRSNDQTWRTSQFDLLPYAGQPIDLRFSASNNTIGGSTGMLVDDVVLKVCTP